MVFSGIFHIIEVCHNINSMKIPISKVEFTEKDLTDAIKPLTTGWVVQGPFVKEFENKWSQFTGAKNSIAVSNCTTALHMSLAACGIKTGDEVIVPAFTWISTANVVEYLGAKPIFCDIDLPTYNIDPKKIELLITPRTKAIIPVHLFGLAAEMNEINQISKKHNLLVIEDAACGFASRYNGKHVGNLGNIGCFSFHPRKAITTGEGGMITTQDDELAVMLRSLRDHGASISDHHRHTGPRPYLLPEFPYLGYNYRMTDLQGALGASQMDRAEEIFNLRQNVAKSYDQQLADINFLWRPKFRESIVHGLQAYVLLFGGPDIKVSQVPELNKQRNKFMDYLQNAGVSTRPGTHAVHMLEYYRNKYQFRSEDFPNSYIADQCSIALPIYPSMTPDEVQHVIETIKSFKAD